MQIPRGVGILFILNSAGMVGKNTFEDFCVSPILVFTNCHPLLRENRLKKHDFDTFLSVKNVMLSELYSFFFKLELINVGKNAHWAAPWS